MSHPDFDEKPSRNPFDKYPVIGYRREQGGVKEERFFVIEMDLTRDNLGPRTFPSEVSETQARSRLTELGLSKQEIEARLVWCRKWMATRILKPGQEPVMPFPPL